MNYLKTLQAVFYLLIVPVIFSVTACSSQRKISVFEANQIRRTTDETERNLAYIKKLSKECEDNSREIASLVQQMNNLQENGHKK